jgi:hypothetical protein
MNIPSLRTAALAGAVFALLFAGAGRASAVDFSIQIGTPQPPPRHDYHRWAAPYPGAVWISGHNEWVGGRWVWIGGYYAYPPSRGAVWVGGHYHHGYWVPGHWQ